MLQLNTSCYCKSSMTQETAETARTCRNCAGPISKGDRHYLCSNFGSRCLYDQVVGSQSFIQCLECYESSTNDQSIESTATDFIYRKFNHSLNTISLVTIL